MLSYYRFSYSRAIQQMMLDYCVSLGNPLISFVAIRSNAVGASTDPLAVAKCSESIVSFLVVDTATIRQWPPLRTLGRNSCKKAKEQEQFSLFELFAFIIELPLLKLQYPEIGKKHVVIHCAQPFNPSRRNISWYVSTRRVSAAESRTMESCNACKVVLSYLIISYIHSSLILLLLLLHIFIHIHIHLHMLIAWLEWTLSRLVVWIADGGECVWQGTCGCQCLCHWSAINEKFYINFENIHLAKTNVLLPSFWNGLPDLQRLNL